MLRRFRLFEQTAFALTILFAVACFVVIVYQRNPELLVGLDQVPMPAVDPYPECPARMIFCAPDIAE